MNRHPGFWPYLLLAILAAAGAVMVAAPASSQERPCLDPDMVAGWLRDRGFALDAWGLDRGDMEELWIGPDGWAVVRTTPGRCAAVVSMPEVPGGRLSEPRDNPIIGAPLASGEAM